LEGDNESREDEAKEVENIAMTQINEKAKDLRK
jgi:hypothetical protein